jgi:hypothetical protein
MKVYVISYRSIDEGYPVEVLSDRELAEAECAAFNQSVRHTSLEDYEVKEFDLIDYKKNELNDGGKKEMKNRVSTTLEKGEES